MYVYVIVYVMFYVHGCVFNDSACLLCINVCDTQTFLSFDSHAGYFIHLLDVHVCLVISQIQMSKLLLYR